MIYINEDIHTEETLSKFFTKVQRKFNDCNEIYDFIHESTLRKSCEK